MLDRINLKLETRRLILRPMLATDFEGLLIIFTDPKVMASFGGEVFSRAHMDRWLKRNLEHQIDFGYGLFSVIHKEKGTLIGDCGLERMDSENAAELGYDFRSDYWNQGLAAEAALAVREYAFDVLHLPRLISLIRVGNLASKRVAEKVGMKFVDECTRCDIRYWRYEIFAT